MVRLRLGRGTVVIRATPRADAAAVARPGGGDRDRGLVPGNPLVSGNDFTSDPCLVAGNRLPPGCTSGCVIAMANGDYPGVFNNDTVDGSFGVTSKIFLDELTPSGRSVARIGVPPGELVTSFSPKSGEPLCAPLTCRGNGEPDKALPLKFRAGNQPHRSLSALHAHR
ncbi:MAG: hypothetical protein JOY82_07925 [Streptosporangiaceae bacterium]|nr:hypothetical protein [Streptosporangiaceae bacterium]